MHFGGVCSGSTNSGSAPSHSIGACCGSTQAVLLQGRKGLEVIAVSLLCVTGTRASGRENTNPGTVFLLFFSLLPVDKPEPLGRRSYRNIIGPGVSVTVKQSAMLFCLH